MSSYICQSCGLTMTDRTLLGTNKDGTPSTEYCKHCYPKGEFNNPLETFEEMVESCIPFMVKEKGCTEAEARVLLTEQLTPLKRWN